MESVANIHTMKNEETLWTQPKDIN